MNSIFAKLSSRENISNSLFAKISSRENNVLYSIRRGSGLLANDNPTSTFPGQQSFKRRAQFIGKVGVALLQECLYLPSARSLRRRSALVAENTRPTCAK